MEVEKTSKKGNVVNNDDDNDDIVVLDPLEVNTLFCAPVSTGTSTGTTTATTTTTTTTTTQTSGDDDDRARGHQESHTVTAHATTHCSAQAFQGNTGYTSIAPLARPSTLSFARTATATFVMYPSVSECTAWDVRPLPGVGSGSHGPLLEG
jgi:hypothetical protein